MNYFFIVTLLCASSSLFSEVKDLPNEEQIAIAHVAICGVTKEDDRTIPRALREANGDYTNFVARIGFLVDCDIVPLKRFETAEDIEHILSLPGTSIDAPPCRFQLTVRKVTWYYVLQRVFPHRLKHLTYVDHTDASLASLQSKRRQTIDLPSANTPNPQQITLLQPQPRVEDDDDWIMVDKPSTTHELE